MRKRFYVGLDLGSASDFSALAVIERHESETDMICHCRHLRRWPLRTSYERIVADAVSLVNSAALQNPAEQHPDAWGDLSDAELSVRASDSSARPVLAVDVNGPGMPVVDMLRGSALGAQLLPVFSHGGDKVVRDAGVTRVPKRELVSTAQIALQSGRLKIAPALSEAQTLVRELEKYQVKINPETAHDSYGAWRTGQHDDLCFAVMLALWVGLNNHARVPHAY